jgi:hypothetical protein
MQQVSSSLSQPKAARTQRSHTSGWVQPEVLPNMEAADLKQFYRRIGYENSQLIGMSAFHSLCAVGPFKIMPSSRPAAKK